MNREQRRQMNKKGADTLMSPCTLKEAVQIARGVAEDVVSEYNQNQSHLQIAISLQIEILKSIVIKAGLITEEEFRQMYMEKAEEFNRMQQEAMNPQLESNDEDDCDEIDDSPKMEVKSNPIELKVVE